MISFFEAMNDKVANGNSTKNCQICNSLPANACGRCHAVYYCGKDHQKQDIKRHRWGCEDVAKAKEKMESARSSVPKWVFKEKKGLFDSVPEAREYLLSKIELLTELKALATKSALSQALGLGLECLQLARKDNLGFRQHLPGFMLQLGEFQMAYDFVKWWVIASQNDQRYDWDDTSLPFMDNHDDMFEDPDWIYDKDVERNQIVAIVLIKLVLFTFLVEMACMDLLPVEESIKERMQDEIHRQTEIPDLSPKRIKSKYVSYNYAAFVIKKQLVCSFNHCEKLYSDVWKTLVDPMSAVANVPDDEHQPPRIEDRTVSAPTALCVITFGPFLKSFRNAFKKIEMLKNMNPEDRYKF